MVAPLQLLIVEDSLDDTEIMLYELRLAGLEPHWQRVETEADYVAQLAVGFDVIIADYRLPQFDAMRALELLQECNLDIPLIVVTGSISEEVAVECMKQGAADYLLKDRLVRLPQAVLQTLQQKQLRQEKRQAEIALLESEARFRRLADNAQDIIYRYRIIPTSGFEYVSLAATAMTGYTPAEHYADPQLWYKLVHEEDRWELQQWMRAEIAQPAVLRWIRKDGGMLWTEHTSVPVHNQTGSLIAIEGIARDISQRKQAEAQLVHNAFHDALTGLPNRVLFMDRLRRAVEYSKRHQDYLFAVLFLDLDRFKVINDSLGHTLGDQLLIAIARQLEGCLRPTDTVARFGGDEFTLILEDIKDISDAVRVAERIQRSLSSPFNLRVAAGELLPGNSPSQQGEPLPKEAPAHSYEVFTTASIGITLNITGRNNLTAFQHRSPSTLFTATPEDLLRDADNAMYRAKELGKARYEIFDPAMHARAVALLQLETDLRRAIERQEFQIYYQPIVLLGSQPGMGKVIGFEALVRWQHPNRGLVLPEEFIPVAEETGLSISIDQWVIRGACHQLQKWQKKFLQPLALERTEHLQSSETEPSSNQESQLSTAASMVPQAQDNVNSKSELKRPQSTQPLGTPSEEPSPTLTISVNLCSPQFKQPKLLQYITGVLQETNLSPCSLNLEITENVIMKNHESAATRLLQLRELGVHLSIDDFGTGYSSLGYLHHFPIDILKIDRSFITLIGRTRSAENSQMFSGGDSLADPVEDDTTRTRGNLEIVETIMTLARKLGVCVTAEGIETVEQLEQLRSLNCDYGQGYFFSQPLNSEAAEAFMMAQPHW